MMKDINQLVCCGSTTKCTILPGINLPPSSSNIYWPTKDSNTLDTVEVKDIGRKSLSIVTGGTVFGTGPTVACFHADGIVTCRIEQ